MNIWDILGIEYTQDVVAIRKAYMKKSKEIHPEEHPEEFMDLQKAYKQAVRMAKQHKAVLLDKTMEVLDEEETVKEAFTEFVEESSVNRYDFSMIKHENSMNQKLADEFFWQFQQIYNCFYLRNKVQAWKYIMENRQFEELFEQADFIWQLSRLLGKMEYINQDVWDYMVEWFENHQYYSITEDALFYVKQCREELAHSMVADKTIASQQEIIDKIVHEARIHGMTKESALRMEYFIPHYLQIKKRKEYEVLSEQTERMQNPERYRKKEQKERILTAVVMIVVFIFLFILIKNDIESDKKNSQKNQPPTLNVEEIAESFYDLWEEQGLR